MTPEQFAYWLQGFVELQGSEPTAEQWQQIKDHLQTVFVKVTPKISITQPSTQGPATTQEDRPGKKLEDALREIGYPHFPGLTRTVIC